MSIKSMRERLQVELDILTLLPEKAINCDIQWGKAFPEVHWATRNLLSAVKLATRLSPLFDIRPALWQSVDWGEPRVEYESGLRVLLPYHTAVEMGWERNKVGVRWRRAFATRETIVVQITIREMVQRKWYLRDNMQWGPEPREDFPPLSCLPGVRVAVQDNSPEPRTPDWERRVEVTAQFQSLEHLRQLAEADGELAPLTPTERFNRGQ